MYDNVARAWTIHTLWMTCNGSLPTKERLNIFGMLDNAVCSFCRNTEILDHLFFKCPGIKVIWEYIVVAGICALS